MAFMKELVLASKKNEIGPTMSRNQLGLDIKLNDGTREILN